MTIEEAQVVIDHLGAMNSELTVKLNENKQQLCSTKAKATRIIGRMAQDLAENDSITEEMLMDIAEEAIR